MNNGAQLYRNAFTRGITPDPKLYVSEWADTYRVLPKESAAEPGRYRTSRTPFNKEIMDCLSPYSPVREVVEMKATQIGGTEAGNNWLLSIAHSTPGPCLMVLPTVELAQRHSKSKLAPTVRDTPCMHGIIREVHAKGSGNTLLLKEFPGGYWMLGGANSAAAFRSVSIKYLLLDDVDGYPQDVEGEGDPVNLAKKRTDSFATVRKIFICSTPTVKGLSRVEKEYLDSDQSLYHVPCPHCNTYQALEWGGPMVDYGLKWERTSGGQHLPHTAKYKCKHCGALIEERYKTQMLEAGKWVPQIPERSLYKRGFKISSLYSPIGWVSWAQMAQEFIEAKNHPEKLKVFINTRLAETWEDEGAQPDWAMIKARADTYKSLTVPQYALCLTAGVDVQDNRLSVIIKGWGRDEESWLIYWTEIFGLPSEPDVWQQLDNLIGRSFSHSNGIIMGIQCVAIDTGGHYTHNVYNYARLRVPKVIAIKGMSTENKPILGRPTMQDVDYKGTTIKNGVQLWPIGTDTAKTLIYARLKIRRPGPGCMHFPMDIDDDYYRQLTAERFTTKYDSKGHPKKEWVLPSGNRNEALDCEVYAMAAAIRLGITRANWDNIERAFGVTPRIIDQPVVQTRSQMSLKTKTKLKRPRRGGI